MIEKRERKEHKENTMDTRFVSIKFEHNSVLFRASVAIFFHLMNFSFV
jgi:hypothetical protein